MKYNIISKKFRFEYDEKHLKCKCGSDLVIEKNQKKVNNIIKCSNDDCKSNSYDIKHREYLSFLLPKIVYDEYEKNVILSKRNSSKFCVEYWLKRGFSKEDAIKNISSIQIKNTTGINRKNMNHTITSIDWIKNNYNCSEEEAFDIRKNYFKKSSIRCVEYWINNGYSEEDALKKVSEIQNKSKFIDYNKRKTTTRLQYWLDKGYSNTEAIEMLKERQTTFTLEKCIEKYGKNEGTKKYNNRQSEWKKKVFNKYTCISNGVSKSSEIFINDILSNIDIKIHESIKYGKNEKFITDKNGIHYKYDFTFNKKIIEYNGDFWHCNPSYFKEDFYHPVIKLTAKEIWDKDRVKIDTAKKYGYDILVIWESDYINDPNKEIDKCLEFIGIKNEKIC